ncbi:MAG: phage portal protein [Planctomycetota bacterium]
MTYPRVSPSARRSTFRGSATRGAVGSSMTLGELHRYFGGGSDSGDVGNPYTKVALVFKCVQHKANVAASLPLRVSTANDEVLEDGPIPELLACPNPGETGEELRRKARAWLDLFGKCYLVKTLAGNRLLEYEVRSELEVTEHWDDATGEIARYELRPLRAASRARTLAPEEVVRIADPDFGSGDPAATASVRQAVSVAIRQHFHADEANDHALREGASVGMHYSHPDTSLTEDQVRDLGTRLTERFSGPRRRNGWMVTQGNARVEAIGSSFKDMEFSTLKRFSRDDICLAFGCYGLIHVHSPVEGQATKLDAAQLYEWEMEHLPWSERFAASLTEGLMPHFDRDASLSLRHARRRGLYPGEARQRAQREARARALSTRRRHFAWFDHSGVPILQRARLAEVKGLAELNRMGVPLNELIDAHDLPYEKPSWGATWFKPIGVVDVADDGVPPDDPGFDPPPPPPAQADPGDVDPDASPDRAWLRSRTTQAELESLWERWWRSWRGLEDEARSRVGGHFNALRSQTLRRLDDALRSTRSLDDAVVRRDLIAAILFDLVAANRRLVARARPIIRRAFQLGGTQAMTEASDATGAETPGVFDLANDDAVRGMRRREIVITEINKTVRRQLAERLSEGAGRRRVGRAARRPRSVHLQRRGLACPHHRPH